MLEDDGVAVLHPVVFEGLLVVKQWHPIENDGDFARRKAGLDLAEGFEILQFQILGHVQDEYHVR